MAQKDAWLEGARRLTDTTQQIAECLERMFPGITRRGGIAIQPDGRSATLELRLILPNEPADVPIKPEPEVGTGMLAEPPPEKAAASRAAPLLPMGRAGLAAFLRETYPDVFEERSLQADLPTVMPPPQAGAKKPTPFGKYFLLEQIDEDAISEYYLARTYGFEGFEKLLVIKRIKPNIAEDEEFIQAFVDEMKVVTRLDHPNISQVFDSGKINDSYFIALEHVVGMSAELLFELQRQNNKLLPIPIAIEIISQTCEALDYAHRTTDLMRRGRDIVHGDIRPGNILISFNNGYVKLTGFGIAKALHRVSKTQAGLLSGRFGYMSPEQVRGLPLDRRSDVFSLGIVLYELLTNQRLFTGESDFTTLEKVRNADICPPRAVCSDIPLELEHVVLKALAKDVDARYQNADEFGNDLRRFLATSGHGPRCI